ncbi:MAG: M28 family peptidase [Bacteroidales bacterium]|jgi:hypothetical protein
MKILLTITSTVALLATVLFLGSNHPVAQDPDLKNLQKIITTLTSPEFEGRKAGSIHDSVMAVYLAKEMESYGFEPFFEDGPLHKFHFRNRSSWNVVMVYKGEETNGSLMLGAHYDHLGMGGRGSGSLKADTLALHPGADDNASGVAAAMETARLLSRQARDKSLQKDIVFAAFGAEEAGTIGSGFLADTLKKAGLLPSLMINLDMVGRLTDSILQISGTGTFQEADSLIRYHLDNTTPFILKTSADGHGPSDHSRFYREEVPVLFITTGPHTDYHTPFDSPDKINYEGMAHIVRYTTTIAGAVAFDGFEPIYKEAYQTEPRREQVAFKVSLGVIPDFIHEGEGLCAGTVIKGRPGHKAGMENGDIILQINDKPIPNIDAYMEALSELTEGEIIWVTIKRKDRILELEVQL